MLYIWFLCIIFNAKQFFFVLAGSKRQASRNENNRKKKSKQVLSSLVKSIEVF